MTESTERLVHTSEVAALQLDDGRESSGGHSCTKAGCRQYAAAGTALCNVRQ